jgi:hypothetical protein
VGSDARYNTTLVAVARALVAGTVVDTLRREGQAAGVAIPTAKGGATKYCHGVTKCNESQRRRAHSQL